MSIENRIYKSFSFKQRKKKCTFYFKFPAYVIQIYVSLFVSAFTPSLYILFEDSLWTVTLGSSGATPARQVTSTDNSKSLDYHYARSKMYWVDDKNDKVCIQHIGLFYLFLRFWFLDTQRYFSDSQQGAKLF